MPAIVCSRFEERNDFVLHEASLQLFHLYVSNENPQQSVLVLRFSNPQIYGNVEISSWFSAQFFP